MRFRHDPAKAAANPRKHGVSFADAEGVLEVWTERDGECRLISARRPTRKERTDYES
jgi:uncharacterized DUF497 family protein